MGPIIKGGVMLQGCEQESAHTVWYQLGENQVMSPFVSTASCRGPSHVKCLLNVRAAPRNHTASSATNHRALALQPGLLRLNLGLQPHHDHCAALPCYGT